MKPLPSTSKSLVGALFAVALVAWSPLQTRADTIAFSVSSSSSIIFGDNTTLGYAFSVSSPISVTSLGLFDFQNDGLAQSHAVTIWTSTGTQLLQLTISAGTGATLTDGFRYVSIAPSFQALIQSAASMPAIVILVWTRLRSQVLPGFLTLVVEAHLDSRFHPATPLLS